MKNEKEKRSQFLEVARQILSHPLTRVVLVISAAMGVGLPFDLAAIELTHEVGYGFLAGGLTGSLAAVGTMLALGRLDPK